jgi:integrase
MNIGQRRIRDDTLPGFGLTLGTAKKTFFVMYGKERKLRTLGHWPSVSLKDARKAAKAILLQPPMKSRSVSFSEARKSFVADCTQRLRKSTADRYFFALKDIQATTLEGIDLNVTDPTQLKSLKVFYNWCMDRELTDRNPFARRKVIFDERDRVLSDAEVVSIFSHEHPPYSDIVKMLLLTGQRRAQFSNFDHSWIVDDTIVFPSSMMKSGREHILPLLPSWKKHLPTKSSNSWTRNKNRLDKLTGTTNWVLHDCRRYFSTTCAKLGVPLHITELILDHRSQLSGVALIYNRYTYLTEMRDALTLYEKHLNSLLQTAKV